MPPKVARGEYIETDTGNKISRRALLHGTPHIVLAGKSVIQHDVVVRGDLVRQQPSAQAPPSSSSATTNPKEPSSSSSAAATIPPKAIAIHLGRYVFVSPHCTLHPPSRLSPPPPPPASTPTTTTTTTAAPPASTLTYFPLRIADFVYIGAHTYINAATIGNHVRIGAHVSVGNMVVIKDNVMVLDHAVLPAGSVWASGSVVGGRPGRVVGALGEGWGAGGVEGGPGLDARELWRAVGNTGAAAGAGAGVVAGKR